MSNIQSKNSFLGVVIRLSLALIGVLVVLWVLFNIIIPTLFFLLKVIVVVAVLGGIVWIVYKVMNFDPAKKGA